MLDKVYKAKAVLLYFRGVSLRDVQKYLSDEDYHVGKARVCIADRGSWYVKAVKEFLVLWIHETFVDMNIVERWFFFIKHRLKKFY